MDGLGGNGIGGNSLRGKSPGGESLDEKNSGARSTGAKAPDASEPAEASPTSDPARAAEVFYDGACPVCRREISLYQSAFGDQIAFKDVSETTPDGLDRETLLKRFHVRRADGALVSGPSAFFAIGRASRRWGWAARIVDRQPFLAIAELAYLGFLQIRRLWRPRPSA